MEQILIKYLLTMLLMTMPTSFCLAQTSPDKPAPEPFDEMNTLLPAGLKLSGEYRLWAAGFRDLKGHYGDQRLVGAVEWTDTAQPFDGRPDRSQMRSKDWLFGSTSFIAMGISLLGTRKYSEGRSTKKRPKRKRNLFFWLFGYLVIWLFGFLIVSIFNNLVIWSFGYLSAVVRNISIVLRRVFCWKGGNA